MLLTLCALGAGWDLLHARPVPAPPAEQMPVVAAAAAPAGPATAASSSQPLDLNRASAAQFDALPGIGPVLAARIVEHRRLAGPFRSADELLAVRGIGPHLLERLRPLVTARPAGESGADSMQNAIPSGR